MPKNIDTEQRNRILELRAMGKSYASIAEEVKVAKQTAIDICKENEDKVATLKALELEQLYEQHSITKEARIRAHAILLSRIQEEIANRPLTDIPTDKLIDLSIKEAAALRDELIEPNFKSSAEQERSKRDRDLLDSLI